MTGEKNSSRIPPSDTSPPQAGRSNTSDAGSGQSDLGSSPDQTNYCIRRSTRGQAYEGVLDAYIFQFLSNLGYNSSADT